MNRIKWFVSWVLDASANKNSNELTIYKTRYDKEIGTTSIKVSGDDVYDDEYCYPNRSISNNEMMTLCCILKLLGYTIKINY